MNNADDDECIQMLFVSCLTPTNIHTNKCTDHVNAYTLTNTHRHANTYTHTHTHSESSHTLLIAVMDCSN